MTPLTPIRQMLFSPEGQQILAEMPAPTTFSGRMAFARAVCARFEFVDTRGTLRESSCIAALRELETAGRIKLPPGAARKPASSRPLMQSTSVPPALDVPARVDRVLGFKITLVDTKAEACLLHDEHPQGAVQHGGRPWGTVDDGYRRMLRRVTLLCLCFVRRSQGSLMRAQAC